MIGQTVPKESTAHNEEKLVWQDETVTQSYRDEHWIILDNFNTAEASVIERLNPIFEEKPMLILSEKGESDDLTMHDNYRFLATMTSVDSKKLSATHPSELSPSLSSRFAVIHLMGFAAHLLSDQDAKSIRLIIKVIREIFDFASEHGVCFTLRHDYRFVAFDCPK